MWGAHSTVLGVTPDTHISANPQDFSEAIPGEAPADQEAGATNSPARNSLRTTEKRPRLPQSKRRGSKDEVKQDRAGPPVPGDSQGRV